MTVLAPGPARGPALAELLVGAPHEITALARTLDPAGPLGGAWRWEVRRGLGGLRDALLREPHPAGDAGLAARGRAVHRQRGALLTRVGSLAERLLTEPDPARLRDQVQRLVLDAAHHVQRLHDLAYDEVELELGGSE